MNAPEFDETTGTDPVRKHERSGPEGDSEFEVTWDRHVAEWLGIDDVGETATNPRSFDLRASVAKDLARTFGPVDGSLEGHPRKVGAFELVRFLGKGGMGAVFLGEDSKLGRQAAVKLVKMSDESATKALHAEATGLARLRHENIVRFIGYGIVGEYAWLASEYIEGRTLHRVIQDSWDENASSFAIEETAQAGKDSGLPDAPIRVPIRRVPRERLRRLMNWFRDIASALRAMHQEQLVHRDIKPSNILISNRDKPFLIDFGLVMQDNSPPSVRGVLSGTLPYMSPEQTLGGLVSIGASSDIYSLAVTFHEAITGQRVAERRGRNAVLEQVAFGRVPPLSRLVAGVPRSLDALFHKALAKDPQERYASAEQLVDDIDCWLEDRDMVHARERAWSRFLRRTRRHPAIASLSIFVAGGLLGGWGISSWRDHQAFDALLTSARTMKVDGRGEEALGVLRAAHVDWHDRSEWRRALADAALAVARPRTQKLLAALALVDAAKVDDSDYGRLGREADELLVACADAHFVFQSSFRHYLAQRFDAALETLDRHAAIDPDNVLLLELRALLLLECGSRAVAERHSDLVHRLRDVEARLERTSTVGLSNEERTFRALRMLRRASIGDVIFGERQVAERQADVHSGLSLVDAVIALDDRAEITSARTIRGLLLLSAGLFEEAALAFESLERLVEGIGPRCLRVVAMLRAIVSGASVNIEIDDIVSAIAHSGDVDRLVALIDQRFPMESEREAMVVGQVARLLVEEVRPMPADARSRLLRICAVHASSDYGRLDIASLGLTAAAVEELWTEDLRSEERECFDTIKRLEIWVRTWNSDMGSMPDVEKEAAISAIERDVARELGRHPRLDYDLRVALALARSRRAAFGQISVRRTALSDAIVALTELSSDVVFIEAVRAASSEERASMEKTRALCLERLEAMRQEKGNQE